jgi:hypothetical protein
MSYVPNKSSQELENIPLQLKEPPTTTRGTWWRIFRTRERERLEHIRLRLSTVEGGSDKKERVIRCPRCDESLERIWC